MDELTKYLDADGHMTPSILRELEIEYRNDYTLHTPVSSITTRSAEPVEGPLLPPRSV